MFVFQLKDRSAGSVGLQLRHLELHSEFLRRLWESGSPLVAWRSVAGLIVITDKRDALDLFSRSGRFVSYAPRL
jgi:hypothetical protein